MMVAMDSLHGSATAFFGWLLAPRLRKAGGAAVKTDRAAALR